MKLGLIFAKNKFDGHHHLNILVEASRLKLDRFLGF
jgi:hypothetical protein